MQVEIVNGDILSYKEKDHLSIICHQVNCITHNSLGLARSIFDKYPLYNIYTDPTRQEDRKVGNTDIDYSTGYDVAVVHLHGQHKQGKCNDDETPEYRLAWMKQALHRTFDFYINSTSSTHDALFGHDLEKKVIFLFPYEMGCGLAGGKWQDYQRLINEFAAAFAGNSNVTVKIIKYEKSKQHQ